MISKLERDNGKKDANIERLCREIEDWSEKYEYERLSAESSKKIIKECEG